MGVGSAGLAAAIHLHDTNGIPVVVYEIREQPTTLGGAVFIPANGLRLLDRLGVYETLREGGSIPSEMIFQSTNDSELGRLDIASNTKARTGCQTCESSEQCSWMLLSMKCMSEVS